MSPPEASDSAPRRPRTEAQMSQKRLADRVKHKENRHEQKIRMARMETDISKILKNLDDVTSQLQKFSQLGEDLAALQQRHSQRPVVNPGVDISSRVPAAHGDGRGTSCRINTTAMPGTMPMPAMDQNCATPSTAKSDQQSPTESPNANGLMTDLFQQSPYVDCWCGVQHQTQLDCLEYGSFAILYNTHAAFPQNPLHAQCLPKNPTLSNMTLNSYGDNAVTCFLTSFLKCFELASVETLFGIYFFAYRLMRWRLHPDPVALNDVPSWLHPTEAQSVYPHPVSIDYIPWPNLRSHLCKLSHIKSRHSIKLYLESFRLRWPPGLPLLTMDGGQVCISPEFEAIACDLQNWELSPLWLAAFPQLVPLLKS